MKKIKTFEAVAAYKTLKALKTSSMSDDAAMRVWKNMKALRHVADTYVAQSLHILPNSHSGIIAH